MRNSPIRLLIYTLAVFITLSIMSAGTALAAGESSHSDVLRDAETCVICHRGNTGSNANGTSGSTEFCYSCHGRDKSGARTNVQDGVYSDGTGLRGGGFENARMDTVLSGVQVSLPVTSSHSPGQSDGTAWGSGVISSGRIYGNSMTLQCTDCHDLHGNGNYRMLREIPNSTPGTGTVTRIKVTDEANPDYTVSYLEETGFRDTSYSPDNLDRWCTQCHNKYSAPPGAATEPSGDTVFSFRHPTENLPDGCISCHVAHGTSATMGPQSSSVNYPDGTSGGRNGASRLLNTDNRGVCMKCHPGESLAAN